jgi:hypothetical protein
VKRILLVLPLLLVWVTVSADEIKKSGKPGKPYSVSLGWYAENISSGSFTRDIDFSGYSLSMGQVFLDNFDGRITLFSTDNDDLSSLESQGYEIVLHWGTGLASKGFKAYIGGGFFQDTWEVGTDKESFSGLQINGGIGYNWEHVALDFVLAVRDPDDYEKTINSLVGTIIGSPTDISVDAYSTSLLLSYRF